MANPLNGITILELGHFIAGPFAGLQLADYGARVVKIERPGEGDAFRRFFGKGGGDTGYGHNFCAFNRNKLSVALDVAKPEGRDAFRRMAATADVVIENFRPSVMQRLGIGYQVLKEVNPRLIYCSISGFSEDGPYGEMPAFDTMEQALSGVLSLFIDPADPRMRGPTITDQITAMQACSAVLAALFERQRTGRGARIDLSMLEATIAYMPDSFTAYNQAGIEMQPESRTAMSQSFVFTCADGTMIALRPGGSEKWWKGMIDVLGRPDIAADPRFVDRPARIRNFSALIEALRPAFAAKPRAHWIEVLSRADVPNAAVHRVAEVMDDPEVKHVGLFHEIEHPVRGRMTALRRAVRIDGEREAPTLPPPLLGEHTESVLEGLGFTADEIAQLRASGAIAG
jgi:crotonobetainyl-CoA:carnitine CoA-transferase CaiB-like acyl-CoA transferase